MRAALSEMTWVIRILFLGLYFLWGQTAFAVPFGFDNITANSSTDAATGEAQLHVDVNITEAGSVVFLFTNSGPLASSITDVYFDLPDNENLSIGTVTIANSAGVLFNQYTAPPNLPGGESISFSSNLSADSESPTQPNGVNPGESLTITFTPNFDVFAAISASSLRIGIHVQGFSSGESESFVNSPSPVPEPASMILFGTGLLCFGTYNRIKSRKS